MGNVEIEQPSAQVQADQTGKAEFPSTKSRENQTQLRRGKTTNNVFVSHRNHCLANITCACNPLQRTVLSRAFIIRLVHMLEWRYSKIQYSPYSMQRKERNKQPHIKLRKRQRTDIADPCV